MSAPVRSMRPIGGIALVLLLLTRSPLPLCGDDASLPDGEEGAGDDAVESVRWSAGLDVTVDRDGAFRQRSTFDIGSVRTVWWSTGETIVVREEPAPAGMVERSYRFHNPAASVSHRVGATAGPVIFGPAHPRGGYARMSDPSRGGIVPAALWSTTRLVLDRSLEPTTRDGFAVAGAAGGFSGGVGYLFAADRSRVLLFHVGFAPLTGRYGEIAVTGAAAEALTSGRSRSYRSEDDPWLFDTPPPGTLIRRTVAASYRLERGGYGDSYGRWLVPVSLVLEGATQGFAYRPGKRSVQAGMILGPRVVRGSVRVVRVEPGYLDTDLTSTARAEMIGGRLDGRSGFTGTRFGGRGSFEWLVEGLRERRWDDGLPGEPLPSGRGRVTLRTGGVVEKVTTSVEFPGPDRSAEVRLTTGKRFSIGLFAFRVAGHYYEEECRSRLSGEVIFRRPVLCAEPFTLRWKTTVEVENADERYDVEHAPEAEIPVGGNWGLSIRGRFSATPFPGDEWEASVRVRWYRSGIAPAGASDTP
ncbi:MAG: hypothetical protein ACLFSV_04455 [Alkalispirochaeta sp.]